MMARSSNAPSMGRIQKRKTNLSKSSLSACNARPVHTDGPGPVSCTATKSGRFNGAILSRATRRWRLLAAAFSRLDEGRSRARQNNPEFGEVARLGVDFYRPAMLLDDDVVTDGQA